MAAKITALQSRLRIGQDSVDSVLNGTATPLEQDSFNEWLDAPNTVQMPSSGYVQPNGKIQQFSQEDSQSLDQQHRYYTDLAIKFSAQGKTDIAKKLLALAEKAGTPETREARLRAEADKIFASTQDTPLQFGTLQFGQKEQPVIPYRTQLQPMLGGFNSGAMRSLDPGRASDN